MNTRAMFVNGVVFLVFLSTILETNANTHQEIDEENIISCPDATNFRCTNGDLCIRFQLRCDGKEDCTDGSDEIKADCEHIFCKPPEFYMCSGNETCIPRKLKCDGQINCPSGDDEKNCTRHEGPEPIECEANQFKCLVDNMCVPMKLVCDGIRQCSDGSDENVGCLNLNTEKKCSGFLCKNNRCLNDKSWVCDGMYDCADGSDERDCGSDCISENRKFLCADNITCIPIERVCNKEKDCNDGSDEGGVCTNFNNNKGCEEDLCAQYSECFVSPSGPACTCLSGFVYDSTKEICKDINECESYGTCSQGCINTQGSYFCTCSDRFRLANDRKSCEITSRVEPVLVYAVNKSINVVLLRSGHRSVVTENARQPVGLSFDGHFVYWTNVALNSESIVKVRADGSKQEVLLSTGLALPEDVAIDWITGNLYLSDAEYQHIAVCSNDGRYCTKLITENVERPRSIALHPYEGRMYWSEWGKQPMIGAARMDGTFVSPLVNENIYWPNGIALDWPNRRLYWADGKLRTIESCNLDGTGRHTVLKTGLKQPFGLAVFENNIYWSDWGTMSLETCNKFKCNDRKVVAKDRKINDVNVYHYSIQPQKNNLCRNNNCTHLCLLASNETFTCGCPVGMQVNIDKVSCFRTTPVEVLYMATQNLLYTMEHETFGRHQIDKPKVVPFYINKMALNSLNGHVFIADNVAQIIYDYDPVNETAEKLVTEKIGFVSSMSFDQWSNSLYWSDSDAGTIEILSLNRNQRATLYQYFGTEKPVAIAVVPETGSLFVALRTSGRTQIYIQTLYGGSDRLHILDLSLNDSFIQLAVDQQQKEIYFCDSDIKRMSTATYEGQSFDVFQRPETMNTTSIAILNDDIFWTESDSLDVFWTSKENSDRIKRLLLPIRADVIDSDIILIAASPTTNNVSNHPCMIDNGGCSHICATYDATKRVCLCPSGMDFANNQNNTCVDCAFRCGSGECIAASRKCNNITDCTDASDERDCHAAGYNSTIKCLEDEFTCSDGQCIRMAAVCDNVKDCADGLDELNCFDKNATMPMCKWVCGEL